MSNETNIPERLKSVINSELDCILKDVSEAFEEKDFYRLQLILDNIEFHLRAIRDEADYQFSL